MHYIMYYVIVTILNARQKTRHTVFWQYNVFLIMCFLLCVSYYIFIILSIDPLLRIKKGKVKSSRDLTFP